MDLTLIATVAHNGMIGNKGEKPWPRIPEDTKHFYDLTLGFPVIMGRKAYESIVNAVGEQLPGRIDIVLTRNPIEPRKDLVVCTNLEQALSKANDWAIDENKNRIYVAGGGEIYAQTIERADRLEITEIEEEPDGDTYFPTMHDSHWLEVKRNNREGFNFVSYIRANWSK